MRRQTGYECFRSQISPDQAMTWVNSETIKFALAKPLATALLLMCDTGEKLFIAASNLISLLKATDLTSIPGACVKLPFRAQFFECPGVFESDLFNYTGFFATKLVVQENQEKGAVDFLFVGHMKDKPLQICPLVNYRFIFSEEADLLDQIKKTTIDDSEKANTLIKFAVNLLLFINSKSGDGKTESWSDIDSKLKNLTGKTLKNRKSALREKFCLAAHLGGSIKIDGVLRTRLAECQRTNQPLSVRFLVRGHWRHQWMGSGPEHRQELKWIMPFWKGDKDLPYANKPYELVVNP